jgi:ParB-like chromosome segregation protein Spo0J
MQSIKTKISEVKLNPNNPRLIKDDNFKKLVQSIKDFPEMLEIRPIVVNADMVILGGNMRFKACKEAGLKEVPIIVADNLTEEQQREFLIKDNVSGGEWDWSLLSEWDSEQLEDWGLEIKSFETETDYSEKNKELDLNDFEDQKYTIKLEFTEDDYNLVKERLQELGQTPEKILYDALVSL